MARFINTLGFKNNKNIFRIFKKYFKDILRDYLKHKWASE